MKERGLVTVVAPDADRPLEQFGTVQCVHCSAHFRPEPGSGKVRGFCHNCMGPVCGPGCAKCVPVEVLLDNIEQGRPLDFRPVLVAGGWE